MTDTSCRTIHLLVLGLVENKVRKAVACADCRKRRVFGEDAVVDELAHGAGIAAIVEVLLVTQDLCATFNDVLTVQPGDRVAIVEDIVDEVLNHAQGADVFLSGGDVRFREARVGAAIGIANLRIAAGRELACAIERDAGKIVDTRIAGAELVLQV